MTALTAWLDQRQAVIEAATPGPWTVEDGPSAPAPGHVWIASPHFADIDDVKVISDWVTPEDAALITAARTDLPAAVAALRAVLDLHQPSPVYEWASRCGHKVDDPGYDDQHGETFEGDEVCFATKECDVCPTCTETPGDYPEQAAWPCATVRVVAEALGVTS